MSTARLMMTASLIPAACWWVNPLDPALWPPIYPHINITRPSRDGASFPRVGRGPRICSGASVTTVHGGVAYASRGPHMGAAPTDTVCAAEGSNACWPWTSRLPAPSLYEMAFPASVISWRQGIVPCMQPQVVLHTDVPPPQDLLNLVCRRGGRHVQSVRDSEQPRFLRRAN